MKSIWFLIIFILSANVAYSQQEDSLKLVFGNIDKVFFNKITVGNAKTDKKLELSNGTYEIRSKLQQASFIIKNNTLTGEDKVYAIYGTDNKTFATCSFRKSLVSKLSIYRASMLNAIAWRDKEKAYFKTYGTEKRLSEEGWISLDRKKILWYGNYQKLL